MTEERHVGDGHYRSASLLVPFWDAICRGLRCISAYWLLCRIPWLGNPRRSDRVGEVWAILSAASKPGSCGKS